ncbi:MAG TPA: zf-HC2 domain-containing protein [Candidatus Flavonifractor avistercoris]|nr:zf-HC2 domain-containing protein [Candidatus Flavonifractor avistercoris]
MTDCDRALELISAGLDGVLTPEEKDWLEKHLEHCPACRALDADLASLHQLLPTLAPEPPAELKERIMDAVRAEKTVPFPAQGQKKPRRWKAWVSVAAVAALVFLGGRAALPALNSGGASLPAAAGAPAGTELPAADAAQAPEAALQEAPAAEVPATKAPSAEAPASQAPAAEQPSGEASSAEAASPRAGSKTSGGTGSTEQTAEPGGTEPETDTAGREAEITTMMVDPAAAQLDEAGALEALLSHLGLTEADGAGFSSLGLSGDGTTWRFQRTEDGTVYAVPLDGGEITQKPAG